MAKVVPIDKVSTSREASNFDIKRMKKVLEKQGQIEPLQVQPLAEYFLLFEEDSWGNEIVYAARELGWDTLLIVEMKRYEQ